MKLVDWSSRPADGDDRASYVMIGGSPTHPWQQNEEFSIFGPGASVNRMLTYILKANA